MWMQPSWPPTWEPLSDTVFPYKARIMRAFCMLGKEVIA